MVTLKQVGANVPRFPARFAKGDFGITADVTVQPSTSVYGRFGAYTVGKQSLATFGVTGVKAGGGEGEPLFIDLRNASDAVLDGQVQLALYDANGRQLSIVKRERTERLRASQNDRNLAPLLPEFRLFATEDMVLALEFLPDSATAVLIDYDATTFGIGVPVTRVFL